MKLILPFLLACATLSNAQTATDFVANDCNGDPHHLFAELEAGKAVVIVWVMPCAPCISGALTAQTEVESALQQHPGRVVFYLADDFANTTCATLGKWCATNGISLPAAFSNGQIRMSDYGDDGMPKVVVLGGKAHQVFYNANAPDITAQGIRDGIAAALAASPVTVTANREAARLNAIRLYPNPARFSALLQFEINGAADLEVRLIAADGQSRMVFSGAISAGINTVSVPTAGLQPGTYVVQMILERSKYELKLLVE